MSPTSRSSPTRSPGLTRARWSSSLWRHQAVLLRAVCRSTWACLRSSFFVAQPLPVTLDSFTLWWWKVYVDNFDIGEIFEQKVAPEVIHTKSLSQAVYREALTSLGVPRAAEKGISREAVEITMGSVIDEHHWTSRVNSSENSGSRLPRNLAPHAAARLPPVATSQRQDAGFLIFSTGGRVSQVLDHIWKEIVHFHGWHPISATSADELLSCICMAYHWSIRTCVLIYPAACFALMRSEFGVGGCETIGLTTAGVAAGREEAVRAREFEFRRVFSGNRGQGVSAGTPETWQTTGALMCVSICSCPFDRTHGLGPQSAAKMALESRFEISVEKARSTHQWTGTSGPVHTAPKSGQVQWQHWNAFRRACGQFSRSGYRG